MCIRDSVSVLFIRSQPRLDKRGVGLVRFAQLPNLENVPVSYTHLDVYKRQTFFSGRSATRKFT